jgi:acetoacetate decarboxylase
MKIDDVRRAAYSMPLTSPSFPPGPYRWRRNGSANFDLRINGLRPFVSRLLGLLADISPRMAKKLNL